MYYRQNYDQVIHKIVDNLIFKAVNHATAYIPRDNWVGFGIFSNTIQALVKFCCEADTEPVLQRFVVPCRLFEFLLRGLKQPHIHHIPNRRLDSSNETVGMRPSA